MTSLRHLIARPGLAIAALLAVPSAQAAPVLSWNYTFDSIFTGATFSGPGGGSSITPSQLSWGNPAGTVSVGGGRSALTISDSPTNGTIDTNGAAAPAPTITHSNNVVPLDQQRLDQATLQSTLTLTPINPPDVAAPPFVMDFQVDFTETDNTEPCAVASTTPCRDIFVLLGGMLNTSFAYNGLIYALNIFEVGGQLGPLSPAACAAAGAPTPCVGFTTEENQSTPANFAFTITQLQDVSEPSTLALALAGFGTLLLLGGVGRSRRRAV